MCKQFRITNRYPFVAIDINFTKMSDRNEMKDCEQEHYYDTVNHTNEDDYFDDMTLDDNYRTIFNIELTFSEELLFFIQFFLQICHLYCCCYLFSMYRFLMEQLTGESNHQQNHFNNDYQQQQNHNHQRQNRPMNNNQFLTPLIDILKRPMAIQF